MVYTSTSPMMFLQEVLHLLPTVCLLLVKPKCTWTATRPPHWGLQSAQLGREACCWWMATGGGSSPSRITRSSTTTPAKIPRLIQQTALSTPTTKGPHKNHHKTPLHFEVYLHHPRTKHNPKPINMPMWSGIPLQHQYNHIQTQRGSCTVHIMWNHTHFN